ncbi:MAG: cyclic nucleotide-binding/CBS domain-containing protein [Candidatus Accumulibacter sp.]|nr:cyclic nucleotide-binding/CBS domain-containing protein [Accumulibacter sp.]
MHDELSEISDFLADCPPFDHLDDVALRQVATTLVIRYLRRGAAFPPPGPVCLWLLRQGAIELRTADGQLARRMGEGEVYDSDCLPDSPEKQWVGLAVEDTLLYCLPLPQLEQLWATHPEMRQRALHDLGERLRHGPWAATVPPPGKDLASLPLSSLIARPPVCARADATVREGARVMTEQRVSALLIVDRNDRLRGIVTDRDLRSRCLATGLPDHTPLSAIMTTEPLSLPPDATGLEALLEMTRRGIHHLPVSLDGKLSGLVSTTDLLRAQGLSATHLIDRLRRANDCGELVSLAGELPELWRNLARRGESPTVLGHIVAGVADALTSRLLTLSEARLGPPPSAYAWVAFGSQGRQELSLHSDQDNALVFDDRIDPAGRDYFAQLARLVCDGLAACGFIPCPGEMMATNPRWRQSLSAWHAEFSDWFQFTDPHKARLAANLFDLRLVHGEATLVQPLRRQIGDEGPRQQSLLVYLVANGCGKSPPLGFFRQFVVDRAGEHAGELDIKCHGLMPIVDLARTCALAAGVGEISTVARLQAARGSRLLSRHGAEALLAAFEFLQQLRSRHHLDCLNAGLPTDNFIAPEKLTVHDRKHLRDVFLAIATQQQGLLQAFPQSRIR